MMLARVPGATFSLGCPAMVHAAPLHRMLELPVTALRLEVNPAVCLDELDDLFDLHDHVEIIACQSSYVKRLRGAPARWESAILRRCSSSTAASSTFALNLDASSVDALAARGELAAPVQPGEWDAKAIRRWVRQEAGDREAGRLAAAAVMLETGPSGSG